MSVQLGVSFTVMSVLVSDQAIDAGRCVSAIAITHLVYSKLSGFSASWLQTTILLEREG